MSDDPTPGDPDEIRRLADHYQEIADEARTAAEILGQGGAVERGKGEAMDSLREKLKSLPEKLGQTRDSFEAAAAAYKTYATQLEEAQAQTDRAMDQAGPVAATAAQTVPTLAADATDAQRDEARRQQNGIDAAKQTMSAARSLAEQARSLREQAARRAGEELDAAAAKAIPERNIFQKIGDFFADFPLVKIILNVLVAVTAVFFPVVGFVLGAALFTLQTVQQIGAGEFKLGDFLTGLVALIPGGALFRLGGRVTTAIGSKLGPLFGAGAQTATRAGAGAAANTGGFFQRAGGSLTNIKNAFANSKPVSVAFQSPGGMLVTGTIGQFGKGVVEDAAAKGLNGEQITPANILAGAAAGAVTGGVIKGARSARAGEFSGGVFTPPVKGNPPAAGNAGAGNPPAAGNTSAGNPPVAAGPAPAAGAANPAGTTSRSQEFKQNAIEQAAGLIPEGASAATKVGVGIAEGAEPNEALLSEASNFLAKSPGPVGKKGASDAIDSFIPVKGTAPGGGPTGNTSAQTSPTPGSSTTTGQNTTDTSSGPAPQPAGSGAGQSTSGSSSAGAGPQSSGGAAGQGGGGASGSGSQPGGSGAGQSTSGSSSAGAGPQSSGGAAGQGGGGASGSGSQPAGTTAGQSTSGSSSAGPAPQPSASTTGQGGGGSSGSGSQPAGTTAGQSTSGSSSAGPAPQPSTTTTNPGNKPSQTGSNTQPSSSTP
ncbi:putative T7SS-secreted protein [Thermopolyspora sp. NPDC052614]|uniref:putative T7SS-secreted protein n=1 Tax=Thermopolyspora sp. NPDC052614 TaxID=3155682 RepID=UPI00342A213D